MCLPSALLSLGVRLSLYSPRLAIWLLALFPLALASCSQGEVSDLASDALLADGYWFPFEVDSQDELGDYRILGFAARAPEGDSLVSLDPERRLLLMAQMPEVRAGESWWRVRTDVQETFALQWIWHDGNKVPMPTLILDKYRTSNLAYPMLPWPVILEDQVFHRTLSNQGMPWILTDDRQLGAVNRITIHAAQPWASRPVEKFHRIEALEDGNFQIDDAIMPSFYPTILDWRDRDYPEDDPIVVERREAVH